MRLFLAIELETKIKNALRIIQDELKQLGGQVKWVEPNNLHLTIKFLGDVQETKLEPLKTSLQNTAKKFPSFAMEIAGVGVFPNIDHPNIIWVGAKETTGTLTTLATQIEEALDSLDFQKEKRGFSAHITIGRVKSFKNISHLTEKLNTLTLPNNLRQSVPAVTLFKSTLTPQGPVYEVLAQFHLTP